MNSKRTSLALSVLPIMLVAGQGVAAAAPGQPGLAVPGEGQPGLSTTPQSPPAATAPSPADWIPDPPIAPPNRPRPQQQTQPDVNTLVGPKPQATQPDTVEPEPEAVPQAPNQEVMPTDPHKLRVGVNSVQLPDFIDLKTRNKAQAYLDMAEWQIAATYDRLGFPQDQSDRMAASSFTGAGLGLAAGGLATVAAVPVGCAVGAVVGGIAGGLIGGIPTAGVGAPAGVLIGGVTGCLTGAAVVGIPAVGIIGTLGAMAAGALGGGNANQPPPPDPATVDQPFVAPVSAPVAPVAPIVPAVAPIPAAQPVYDAVAPIAQQVETVVNQVGTQVAQTVDQVTQTVETTVDSLRSAVAQMPPLTPESFLAGLAPAPGA
ncbi:hypothetical protein ACFVUS_09960 [Nocardia sp. NPDC058058]|uniref:hypothetical protein n=1 Tax=Nocardia sp. NPDC058058 TaxID=3346317 RepID=UPI0036DC2A96